mmetsp:Transcript_19077/g.43433  ORF Transcript_19077/g.43433 Transcript_19077/m.43433 type:complete len:517 (-) Transcript_19077:139-1689(-)|eukprot:CAMPEP_0113302698 /NCGR_PEP_ID=MMETSP0010_2-20120614/3414_1 /TAXON_ID=216773 ORGANISM="Corethron hystrix, Strain 308" /NCGR_SAMPLE_ID=MMETSP0010_2 /ASSEMBLY_ACC=CAM_ASM_000155 /LENGTH=516 /DNA_ID=CAMNT_0000156555 /DNA_START=191 /DNA_END=1741 /DNA_ORIENTATION=+ /assembly_acc=CAM_ASM_000155
MKQKRMSQPCSLPLPFAATALTLLALSHHTVGISVNDSLLRSAETPAVIGRGFSLATGKVLNSCMLPSKEDVERVPSYDYDFSTTPVQGERTYLQDLRPFKNSAGNIWLKTTIEQDYLRSGPTDNDSLRHLVAYMFMDRYYNSLDENTATVTDNAQSYLVRQEPRFIEFFQVCGPTFVKSIRLTAEVIGLFKYIAPCDCSSYDDVVAASLRNVIENADTAVIQARAEIGLTTKIYGLSMNANAGDILVNTMEGFALVADFAFQAMQNSKIGLIKSIEVMQWVNAPQFQILSKLNLATEVEQCYGGLEICSPDKKKSVTVSEAKKKFNLIANAEHVLQIDDIMGRKNEQLSKLSNCLLKLDRFPIDQRNIVLLNKRRPFIVTSNTPLTAEDQSEVSQYDLDAITVGRLSKIFNELLFDQEKEKIRMYVNNYYDKCLLAVGGANGGDSAFLTHWIHVPACNDIVCTLPDAYYDVEEEKCKRNVYTVDEDGIEIDNYWILMDTYCSPELTGKTGNIVLS